ncbi:ATP-binding protein [Streptomyces sp. TG1A-8]|uniref:ATP-binding protein n=1 Tax=Streptomyces sp. TG1A-8 TaxID=3051385 RepID=UPI00265C3711|nr:ATP-binding protein [Streptomyces sp. TG1A-8]MDO0928211.1 ATP-binding protein [Streptomyces sp. TG1A-8]
MPSVHGGAIVASVIPPAPLGTDAAADPRGLGAAPGAAPGGGAAERRFRFELAAHPASPAQARRLTRARLTGWSVCADTCDSAALIMSELVTNAIVHTASSRVVCELHDHDDTVRIAVRDEGCAPDEPHPCAQRPEEEHGRGLLLVDALCRSWGAQEHGAGLLVWAELARQTDAVREAAEPHGDLGWGARSKPGSARKPAEDERAARARRDGTRADQHQPGSPRGTEGGRAQVRRETGAAERHHAWGRP